MGVEVRVSEVASRIRTLVSEQLGVDPTRIASESSILEDLGADSLDVVELVMAIEDEFDIEVPDEDAESIRTIADVERYVTTHMS